MKFRIRQEMLALAMVVALVFSSLPQFVGIALAAGDSIPHGTYTGQGEWVVVRQVNWPAHSISVFKKWLNAGETLEIFDHPASDPDHSQSAWRDYPSEELLAHGVEHEAWEVACLDKWAIGFSITKEGAAYNKGDCHEPTVGAKAPASSGGACVLGNVIDLGEGDTAEVGSLTVIETVNFNTKEVYVNAGRLTEPFTEHVDNDTHYNGWTNYCNGKELANGACKQARERYTESRRAGSWAARNGPMTVYLQNQPFNGDCGSFMGSFDMGKIILGSDIGDLLDVPPMGAQPAMPQPDAVMDLRDGQVAPAGQWAVVEVVNHLQKTSCIWYGQLSSPVPEKAAGQIDVNVWDHYGSKGSAQEGAESLYAARTSTATVERDGQRSALFGYRVAYHGSGCSW